MARARNIKPSFFTNEVLGTLEPIICLLFSGLWCLADRDGILEDRPLRIKAELFPYREGLDINGYLTVLERSKFIQRYEVAGVAYIKVLNFEKHQTPHHTEKSKGYPQPQGENKEQTLTPLNNGESTVPTRSDSLIPDSLIPDSKTKAQDKPARFDPLALPLPKCIPADAWTNWIAYRRENGWSVKERTVREQIAKLETWARDGISPEAAIRECISNGYQGLFPPKSRGSPPSYHDERKQTITALTTTGGTHEPASNERDITGQAERIA